MPGGVVMDSILTKKIVTLIVSVITLFFCVSSEVKAADGGKMGAWLGTNNSGSQYYSSNGTGGTVQWSTSNSSFSGNYLGNQGAGPSYQGTSTTAPLIYSNTNNVEPMYFRVVPSSGYKIKWVRYGRIGDLYDEAKDGHLVGDQKYDSVTFTSSQAENTTTGVTFQRDIKDGRDRFIWVLFEPTSTTTYSATASIVTDFVTSTTLCSSSGVITTPATSPYTISNITSGNSAVFKFKNTSSDCELEGISFNDSLDYSQTGVTGPDNGGIYTYTKAITTDSTVKIRFRKKGFLITSSILPADGTCGVVSPVSVTVTSGGSYEFSIIPVTGCAISQVLVTNPAKSYNNTDVTTLEPTILNGGKYTFTNVAQTGNTINVTFVQTSTTLGGEYCQTPPFLAGLSVNKPNVLIVFDTSGSMADKAYSGKSYSTGSGSSIVYNKFYGYFDNTKMYEQDSNNTSKYNLVSPQPTTVDLSSNLSGNRLNYDNMEKVDVIRKILVGGKVDSTIVARGATGTKYLKTNNNKLVQYGAADPTGLLQDLSAKVRFGLMVFNDNGSDIESTNPATTGTGDGGNVVSQLGSSIADITATIESSATNPSGNTPLAESLYEAIRYFQAKPSAYNLNVDYGTMDPIVSSCQKHFVLMLTDGEPTKDLNVPGASGTNVTDSAFTSWYNGLTDTAYKPTALLPKVAYYAHNNDLRSSTVGLSDIALKQNLTVYTVFAFGNGSQTLKDTAKYGAYIDSNGNNKPDLASEYTTGYYEATDGEALESSIKNALTSILSSTASGTAAAVANNKSGERGANIIQALFYPQWPSDPNIKWLGEMQTMWYYLDPIISYSGIYEDTVNDNILDLLNDKFPSGDSFSTKALWRAGAQLQKMSAANRNIYTPLTSAVLTDNSNAFSTSNRSTLRDYMNLGSTSLISDTQADKLINYIRGTDSSEYRSRKVFFTDPVTKTTANPSGTLNTSVATEWKLGDIINSTPQVQSSIALNAYDKAYSDLTYSRYLYSNEYKAKNVVYSGSNDGLMHAFRLGLVTNINDGAHPNKIASIAGTDLGKEEWAFIPKNALPYLQNQAGIEYCHQCLVDGAPSVIDASIFKPTGCSGNYWDCTRTTSLTTTGNIDTTSWGTVLVSGMGLGGASRDLAGNCNETLNHDTVASNNKDCVKTPKVGIGLSSYFALDVTSPLTPKFMWEFSDYSIATDADKGLGFTTAGVAMVRINARDASGTPDKSKNGRWFAVFASGPTGPILNSQFLGRSDQNLKIYIVDLNATMPFTKGTNYWVKDTNIPFAFASSLLGSVIDTDRWSSALPGNYSDDMVYITYTKASLDNSSYPTAWDKGGVLRLVTNNDPNPDNWFYSSLIENTGPITTSVGKIQDRERKKLWVYFGEGRYFYTGDELNTTRKFYGVEDSCYSTNNVMNTVTSNNSTNCPAVSISDLQDQSGDTPSATLSTGKKGWYVTMSASGGTAGAERVMADVTANMNGIVYYGTYTPNTDTCTPGGTSSVWAIKYDTGGVPPTGSLVGKAPVQTSSGGINLVDLSTVFTGMGGRKSNGAVLQGLIGRGPIRTLTQNPAVRKILHIQEK